MLFESYKLNYRDYYIYGRETAEWILNLISNHIDLNKQIKNIGLVRSSQE